MQVYKVHELHWRYIGSKWIFLLLFFLSGFASGNCCWGAVCWPQICGPLDPWHIFSESHFLHKDCTVAVICLNAKKQVCHCWFPRPFIYVLSVNLCGHSRFSAVLCFTCVVAQHYEGKWSGVAMLPVLWYCVCRHREQLEWGQLSG